MIFIHGIYLLIVSKLELNSGICFRGSSISFQGLEYFTELSQSMVLFRARSQTLKILTALQERLKLVNLLKN